MDDAEKEFWDQAPLVADVLKHPAFPTAMWNLDPTRSGLLPVAQGRGGPFNISWAIHGHGPVKMVFLMGLGTLKSAWQRQTLHFGHERGSTYSVLIMDNRGMGDSDVPLMRYSTSEMARDAIEVLQHVGWLPTSLVVTSADGNDQGAASSSSSSSLPPRSLHVLGISMGGMIAQEVACMVPRHLASLALLCTAAAIENTTSFRENIAARLQLLLPRALEPSVRAVARNTFPIAHLAARDETHLPDVACTPGVRRPTVMMTTTTPGEDGEEENGRTEDPAAVSLSSYLHFETNYQRVVANEMHKRLDRARFTTTGFVLQLVAAGWHHKSAAQLAHMADAVGRRRILVLHGGADRMISLPLGHKLMHLLGGERGGITAIVRPAMGHVPPLESTEWFHRLIEDWVGTAGEMDGIRIPSS